jgi:hypothetical protein
MFNVILQPMDSAETTQSISNRACPVPFCWLCGILAPDNSWHPAPICKWINQMYGCWSFLFFTLFFQTLLISQWNTCHITCSCFILIPLFILVN